MLQNVDSTTKEFIRLRKPCLVKSAYSDNFYVAEVLQSCNINIRILVNIITLLVNSTDTKNNKGKLNYNILINTIYLLNTNTKYNK